MGFLSVVEKVTGVVDKFVPDKDAANRLKSELAEKIIEAQAQIVVAEAQGDKIQRHWRPHLMYLIMILLVWLIMVGPVIDLATGWGLTKTALEALKEVPDRLWGLLTIGLGGYVMGRSGEKIVKSWRSK